MSLPLGVVTLAERYGGNVVSRATYDAMVEKWRGVRHRFAARTPATLHGIHMLGTSGTVTTIAGVHLNLKRYDRNRVDGCWMSDAANRPG